MGHPVGMNIAGEAPTRAVLRALLDASPAKKPDRSIRFHDHEPLATGSSYQTIVQ
jgi:hypothetical protein